MFVFKTRFENVNPGEQYLIREFKLQFPLAIRIVKKTGKETGNINYEIYSVSDQLLALLAARLEALRKDQDKLQELAKL